MGRRAKNKQSPPQPLDLRPLSGSKSAKRKAENDDSRPKKKLKDVSNKVKHQSPSNPSVLKSKGRLQKSKDARKKQTRSVESEEGEEGSGWEDMEDDETNLKAQAK